ncbi:MAG: histidine kinase [Spirochaetales bacterium]|nr:histidine kinase [Spirochaetales bacterium]
MIPRTLRSKIFAGTAVILVIMSSATFYTGLASAELARSVEMLFRDNLALNEIRLDLALSEQALAAYLTTKGSDALKDYIAHSSSLAARARPLNREIRPDEALLLQRLLGGLVERYLSDAEAAVASKRGRDVESYAERFEAAGRDADLAREVLARVESLFIADSLEAFTEFNARIPSVLLTNGAMVLAATALGLALLARYAFKLTEPLSRLAEAAREVGEGRYDHELPSLDTGDEIGTTAAAFAAMSRSVREAFEELKSKAEVERSLMEERVRLLDMDHKLKDAELLALQTQINPHFLFNTLAAGQQLALSENNDRTAVFLETLAAFIRYALKPPSRSVRVADEIESVRRYVWLLKVRFGERYEFSVDADTAALDVRTPALVLQPLVENAVGHGLRDREEGGRVRVSARIAGNEAVLEVSDTGDGMPDAEIERIFSAHGAADDAENGIGLRNVVRRVELATEGLGRVEIEASEGVGTTVRIRLPLDGGWS